MLSPLIVIEWISKLDETGIEHFESMLLEVKKADPKQHARFIAACESFLAAPDDIYQVDFGDERN